MNQSFSVNEFINADNTEQIQAPEVHPLLVVCIGSTKAEAIIILHQQKGKETLPHRFLVIDTLPYEDLVARLIQRGYTRQQIADAIPQSHYFELSNPFGITFDFDSPLNRPWNTIIFEESLKRIASKPTSPGSSGTPAFAAARVQGSISELQVFFEQHNQALTQVSTETVGLLPGTIIRFLTTFRGGTGTGATTLVAAVLRSVTSDESRIFLRASMPCIYAGDKRSKANAFAAIRESNFYHSYGSGVPTKEGDTLRAPFDAVTYTFVSNDSVSLNERDAIMQDVAIILAYLRPKTQAAINSRYVDLTDTIPYDLHKNPMNIRQEKAISISAISPNVLDFLVYLWIYEELQQQQTKFESYCQNNTLSPGDEKKVEEILQQTIDSLNLTKQGLISKLNPSPAAETLLRNYIDQTINKISTMMASDIKDSIDSVPAKVRDFFSQFQTIWTERGQGLSGSLHLEITKFVKTRLIDSPYLVLEVIKKLAGHFSKVAQEVDREAETKRTELDKLRSQLADAIAFVKEAGRAFFRINEVTRNAGHDVCRKLLLAGRCRIQYEQNELLAKALEPLIAKLHNSEFEQVANTRQVQATELEELKRRLESLEQNIDKRSYIFQRTLLFDGMSSAKLKEQIKQLRSKMPVVPAIQKLLRGEQTIEQTALELVPLLPFFAQSNRSLTEILTQDQSKFNLVVQLLRNIKPFTPLDHVIENQQELKGRRDHFTILEVPGGADGFLGQKLFEERVVLNRNEIVDSCDGDIRVYYVRDGLPASAIKPLAQYKKQHDEYLSNPNTISPYTRVGFHALPDIKPSQINLRTYTEKLLYSAKALLPSIVTPRFSGGFILHYEKSLANDFKVAEQEEFPNFASMMLWFAKNVAVRNWLDNKLNERLDKDPNNCKTALVMAWQQATGTERDYLQEILFSLRVDPSQFPIKNLKRSS